MIVCKGHIWDTFSLVDDNFVVVLPGGGVLHLHHGVACQHGGEVKPSETDGGNTCVWWGVWTVATRTGETRLYSHQHLAGAAGPS